MDLREESHGQQTFSQEGEDTLIFRMLKDQSPGFYVDVGCYHPYRFSNTYRLYKMGWRGMNIDANPATKGMFDAARPDDINIDATVSDRDGETIKFDLYKEPAFNSAVAERRGAYLDIFLETIERPSLTLRTILARNLPAGVKVDLITVDVEGWEANVLRGNDWDQFHPSYVMVETEIDLHDVASSPVVTFMKSAGYRLRSYLFLTAIFTPAERGFW